MGILCFFFFFCSLLATSKEESWSIFIYRYDASYNIILFFEIIVYIVYLS